MRLKDSVDRNNARDDGTEICEKLNILAPRSGFDIGRGWLPIVERALTEMVAVGWNRELTQVKQKMCGLRIYVGKIEDADVSRRVYEIISVAEAECDRTCEVCGGERLDRGSAYGWALCLDCGEEEKC